jgi:serine protease Do
MQHAAILRSPSRGRLRNAGFLRKNARRSFRKIRLTSAFLAFVVVFSVPMARARAGHSTVQKAPGYLGIEFHDLTHQQAEMLHLRGPQGVEVLLVDHDGPAAAAGLQPHDLITGINGHVVPSGEALRRMIHDTGAGVMVTLSVFRNGNPITIRAKLANHEDIERRAWQRLTQPGPMPSTQGQMIEGSSDSYIGPAPTAPAPAPRGEGFIGTILHGESAGLMVEAMQPQLRSYFGAPKGQGLLVESVEDGSAAEAAGMQAGDVLVRANSQPMRSASDWTKQLRASKGKAVALDVVRDRHEMMLTLPAESKKR